MMARTDSQEAEERRLDAVRRYDVLDTPPDGAFDRITAMVSRLLNVPISIVSIVDRDRIWFKSHHGVNIEQVDRDPGLCASAILQAGPWEVPDAAIEPRTLANPLVAGSLGLRFYLGIPLKTHDGHNLGTLCAIDREPRKASDEEIQTVRDLASIVMDELELRLSAARALAIEHEARDDAERAAASFQRVAATLEQGLESNRLIGNAIGLMMANYKTDSDEAFNTLRKASQDSNIKLSELAREIVEYHNARHLHGFGE